jgi:micrococcal nuclease
VFEYRARLIRVVDGDTIWADVDLGCDVHIRLSLRLEGLNTPELSEEGGMAARDRLTMLLGEASDSYGFFLLRTLKDRREKYGRYLASLWHYAGEWCINDRLLEEGVAKPLSGLQ